MKLVIVGWSCALIAFALGFAFGRRARRREQLRDAMLQASMMMAAHYSVKDILKKSDKIVVENPPSEEEMKKALSGTKDDE